MPVYDCPYCQGAYTAPTESSATHAQCPHCDRAIALPKSPASRWFYARNKKKYGPFTWKQLVGLVKEGEVRPEDMLLEEGAKQWIAAGNVESLFGASAITAKPPKAAPPRKKPSAAPRRGLPLALIAGVGSVGFAFALGLVIVIVWFFMRTPDQPRPAPHEHPPPDKKIVENPPPKNDPPPKQEPQPKEKPPADTPAQQLLAEVNRQRRNAGLAVLTLDAELSRGCLAHAQYLAKHVTADNVNAVDLRKQDPKKAGHSEDGQRAAEASLLGFGTLGLMVDHWLAKLSTREAVLNPDITRVGVGLAEAGDDNWFCVIDVTRGRGTPIVVFPAPRQTGAPTSFSGGAEVTDDKAAGFPITITFPPGATVADGRIDVIDEKSKVIDGWRWTPQKPVQPNDNRNSIVFIPKGLLTGNARYTVQASAQVDGKPWNLKWTFTTDDDSDTDRTWVKKALARVNKYRKHAGLKPVMLDASLHQACLKHARYLVINEGHPALRGLDAHGEDLSLPGASKEGHDAGKASNIAIGDIDPLDGLDSWMATLYHRVPMLDPRLERIGFACARGRRQMWVTLLNVSTGRAAGDRTSAVFYPAADQVDVPLHFPSGGEEPNPIPDDKDGRAGYPITATFPLSQSVTDTTGKLTDDTGKEIACWFSSPEKVANPAFKQHQGNTICLIAKDPFTPKMTYHVHLQATLAGKAWQKKWQFTTAALPDVDEETKSVVDQLNAYRAAAGLGLVTLDERLSEGCQKHAAYLVQNAGVSLKSVNDEDPKLPGFSEEGRRAASRSMVFTNAPQPVTQIDDLIATYLNRVFLLNPTLQRVGYGCALDVGRGWRCVLDLTSGVGDSRVMTFPGFKQVDVPSVGRDAVPGADKVGFPITMSFPRKTVLRNAQAILKEVNGDNVNVHISSPEKPLVKNLPRPTVVVYPLTPLQPGRTYEVTISVIADGMEERQTWQFTTAKR